MEAADWDARYAATEPVWTAEPNPWVAEFLTDRPPGSAVDLAAGEGRHALWLAAKGWQVTAVDFAAAGLARGRELAERSGIVGIDWVVADVVEDEWPSGPYSAVLLSYLHLPPAGRIRAVQRATAAVAADGILIVVGHDSANPEHGHGGPQDPSVLYSADDLIGDLHGSGLDVLVAEVRRRPVTDAPRPALDVVLLAQRTA